MLARLSRMHINVDDIDRLSYMEGRGENTAMHLFSNSQARRVCAS